ncbi:hypothetical protein M2347_000533 [Chryseobacterium sp. H1D6B]|uniref:phosphate ABC transporter permease n=1 Tax=Chryseobacterium sp. H1D6B TaxID=2940588 RepID=UPI0017D4340E|nr:phosphate ABC transporter permease [Chryseobacterium sp. H1D6B]MDH6250806.1 hypothetical protein [Chryseobacterium sp. H1D6B]
MNLMKGFFFILMLVGLSDLLAAQKKTEPDIWSGTYVLNPVNKAGSNNADTLIIAKTKDADPKEVAARYESDLARWTIASKKDGAQEKAVIKRFLFNLEDKEDEYEEFGWTELHKEGKMNCIDGGHFFICQTAANSTVRFSKDETYLTKTGIFGIWLHYGVVELQKK